MCPNVKKTEYVQSKSGVYEISYVNTDKNKGNFESVFLKKIKNPDGSAVADSPEYKLDSLSDVSQEYGELINKKLVASDHTKTINLTKGGYSQEIAQDEKLFDFLNQKLASPENNTQIKPAENIFISAKENRKFLLETDEGLKILDKKMKPKD